jgi:hypothetical protein
MLILAFKQSWIILVKLLLFQHSSERMMVILPYIGINQGS